MIEMGVRDAKDFKKPWALSTRACRVITAREDCVNSLKKLLYNESNYE